jgi:poly(3-hydroxybutyrate) depolymerase
MRAYSLLALVAVMVSAGISRASELPELAELDVVGFGPSVVSVPEDDGSAKPLLVATHGAGDRPEWQCDMWRRVVSHRGFVLCPRGKPINETVPEDQTGYFYPTHHAIERELDAAIPSLEAKYGRRVDVTEAVYAGFSQGAIMGGLIVVRAPRRFPRAILIEGSYGLGKWNAVMGRMYRRGGGKRVLFACGGWYCAGNARESGFHLERAGVPAKVVQGRGGHTYGGEVARAVGDAFDWVVSGDDRWKP